MTKQYDDVIKSYKEKFLKTPEDTVFSSMVLFTEYYPAWEPPVSRLRATLLKLFLYSEPPQHIVLILIRSFYS